jgi:hypothetical protein
VVIPLHERGGGVQSQIGIRLDYGGHIPECDIVSAKVE